MKPKLLLPLVAVVLFSCHKSDHNNDSPDLNLNEPSVFTYSPINTGDINFLLSLGWIQPVGHTIPTDHVYFHFPNNIKFPVYAPGGGKVFKILNVPVLGINEVKIWIRMNNKFSYYLDHVVLLPGINEGTVLKAGQQLAVTGLGNSIDLGAIDENIRLPFANPLRYADQTVHCGKPFQYFTDSLKAILYPKVDREGPDKDGRIDIDIPGRLTGNWFLDDGNFYKDVHDWDKELSFAFDIQHPSVIQVSIGGVFNLVGKWGIPSKVPLPSEVSIASGKIAYPLLTLESHDQMGLMLVQMSDETHIKVEVIPNTFAKDGSFSANAKTYAR